MSPALERFAELLVQAGRHVIWNAGHTAFKFTCPCHEDHNPSCDATIGAQVPVVASCQVCGSGAPLQVMLEELGATDADRDAILGGELNGQPGATETVHHVYRDQTGVPVLRVVRGLRRGKTVDVKRMYFHAGDWCWPKELPENWVKPNTKTLLYNAAAVIAAAGRGETVYLGEGERVVDALIALGLPATCNVGGASEDGRAPKWTGAHAEQLRGAGSAVIFEDNDSPGRAHGHAETTTMAAVGTTDIRIVRFPHLPQKSDLVDWLASVPTDQRRQAVAEMVARAPRWTPEAPVAPLGIETVMTQAFDALPESPSRDDIAGALRRITDSLHGRNALDRTNAKLAARDRLRDLGVAAQDAQQLVAAAFEDASRTGPSPGALQGTAITLRDPEPWPDPVDGAELLDEIKATIAKYVVLPEHALIAAALWVLMTYCIAHISVSPRLVATSPTRVCGKTRFLTLLWALSSRALTTSSITSAALFRVIEATKPTLILDEMDNARLNENDELRALLNSGHTRATASAFRTVGEDHEPRPFSTWACIALAAIGNLPDTLMSRAIILAFQRKPRDQKVARLREAKVHAELEPLRRKLARWASDNGSALADADPEMPAALADREADNWTPLLAIADAIGGEWPGKARAAALALSGAVDEEAPGILLLSDLRDLFEQRETDRLSSAEIVPTLAGMEQRSWPEWTRGRDGTRTAITKRGVARLLKPFGIEPDSVRFGEQTLKGYLRDWFKDPWSRYLPSYPEQAEQTAIDAGRTAISHPEQERAVPDAKTASEPHKQRPVPDVPDSRPENEQGVVVAGGNEHSPSASTPVGLAGPLPSPCREGAAGGDPKCDPPPAVDAGGEATQSEGAP